MKRAPSTSIAPHSLWTWPSGSISTISPSSTNGEADFELELTVNKGTDTPYDLGSGYGHMAFCVDDLDAEHARFESAGLNPRKIVEFNRDGALLARFFFVQDPDGYQIEVLQRHGHYQ